MRIRAKTLLVLGIVMLTLTVTAYAVSYSTTLSNIEITEDEDSTFNVKRFVDNLKIDSSSVENTVSDWGTWDDTYGFIENNNTAYVNSNLVDQTFTNLRLNLIAYFNKENQIVWGATFSNQTSTAMPEVILDQLASYKSLFIADPGVEISGLIVLDEMPVLIAAHPILTSEHEGPVHGTLMMGRNLDQAELELLSTAVGLPISVALIGESKMPLDFQRANEHVSAIDPVYLQDLNGTHIAGYALLQDINNSPVALAKVVDSRPVFAIGNQSLLFSGASIAALGISLFLIIAFLLDHLVISRLTALESTVIRIERTGDNSQRVKAEGSDELSSLGESINGMLAVIEQHTITLEDKVAERTKALWEKQEKLEGILNASPDAIVVIDMNGSIIECNDRTTQICGLERSQLVGKAAQDFFAIKDGPKSYDYLLKTVQEKGIVNEFECNLVRKTGKYPAEISLSVLRDKNGHPVGFVSILRDLTERKQLEQRLLRSERFAAIGELAGMIGHDIRNPLTAIKNAVFLLKRHRAKNGDETSSSMINVIENSVENANRIVSDLLDYSREIHLDLSESSPKHLLNQALAMLQVPSSIKLLDNTSSDIKLFVDQSKMVRVFANLVKNAFDAMPKGGTLKIGNVLENDVVRIDFADSGVGVSKEVMPKMFTPLFTTKAQGMGFGLSICKRIVESHGGNISVESIPGEGATFVIVLPVEPKIESAEKIWVIPQKSSS